MKLLLTGGLGYIGSHTCLELVDAGHEVLLLDNLSNSSIETLGRLESIAEKKLTFYNVDIRDRVKLESVFSDHQVDGVMHFAGLKSITESITSPIEYYSNNVNGTILLTEVMKKFGCQTFVFSSSATVYGDPKSVPINENFPLSATNPYGRSKLIIEDLLKDIFKNDKTWRISILRYFNPIGAHKSGIIGENPSGTPNNLIPLIAQVAIGKRKKLYVFGNKYNTPDGTGVRDYIHVTDLAIGHVKALQALKTNTQILTLNLGTGIGYSVLEVIKAFEGASERKIPLEIIDNREGDIAICYANPELATKTMDWRATRGLDEMCEDYWRWQVLNPNGYN